MVYAASLGKLNRRFARWILDLSEYIFTVEHRSGPSNVAADALSRLDSRSADACAAIMVMPGPKLRALQETDAMCIEKKQSIGGEASKFLLRNDVLMHRGQRNLRAIEQIVVPHDLETMILNMCHDEAGHMDFEKTLDKVKRRFWWPQMTSRIHNYVAECGICKRINQPTTRPKGVLIPRKIPRAPNEAVSIDHFGPLPEQNGYTHVLIMIDHATRYVEATTTRGTGTSEILDFLENQWVLKFGVPAILVSDKGRGFVSRRAKAAYHRCGINHISTAAYWAQANDMIERMVKTMKQCLRKYVQSLSTWADSLNAALFAVNTSKQSTTKFSPFYLLHGYEPTLPGEPNLAIIIDDLEESEKRMQLAFYRDTANENTIHAQKLQKQRYDAARDPPKLAVDDVVLYPQRGRPNTLAPYYEELYRVVRFLNENTVEIESLQPKAGSTTVTTANVQQLRAYSPPELEASIPQFLFRETDNDPDDDVAEADAVPGDDVAVTVADPDRDTDVTEPVADPDPDTDVAGPVADPDPNDYVAEPVADPYDDVAAQVADPEADVAGQGAAPDTDPNGDADPEASGERSRRPRWVTRRLAHLKDFILGDADLTDG